MGIVSWSKKKILINYFLIKTIQPYLLMSFVKLLM